MRRAVLTAGTVLALVLAGLWLTGHFGVIQDWLVEQQRAVQNRLAGAVRALRGGEPGALLALLVVCFGYGVLHAAGPGHGKLVIGGYGVAKRVRLLPLAGIALLASMAQAAVAVALVGVGVLVLDWSRAQLRAASEDVMAPVGTAAIAGVGLWLMWRGVQGLRAHRHARRADADGGHAHGGHADGGHVHGDGCGHAHGPSLSDMGRVASWRDAAVLTAGIALRPCSGAVFVLILCFGLGIGMAGIAGTFAMGLGTACVTIAVAALAVWAREGAFANLPGAGVGGAIGQRMAAAIPLVQAVAGGVLAVIALAALTQVL